MSNRLTIFDLYNQGNNMVRDFNRISELFASKRAVLNVANEADGVSIKVAANTSFRSWKNSGRCIDVDDYFSTIGYAEICSNASKDSKAYITYIELIYNLWYIVDSFINKHQRVIKWGSDGAYIKMLMDDILSEMNQKAYYDPETEQCLIGEDSPQVTAAVEATEPETASQILHYNHRQLAGKISEKKGILQNLAKYLEGRESELKPINMQLFTDLNTAFNNLDIRHNNIAQRESFDYKEKLARMSPEELEKWYDDVYQLILLAILEMDNVDRRKRLRTLIQDINQK